MMEIGTVVYQALDTTKPSDRFMAFLTSTETGLLPVYFRAEIVESARNRAIAFWNDENARKAALLERGRKLGEARRKKPPGGLVRVGP